MGFSRFYHQAIPPELEQDVADAIALQNDLRHQVRLFDDFGPLKTIAGIDSGYDMNLNLNKAVVVVMQWPSLELLTTVIATAPTNFPYVPGLLSFREIPAILQALSCLTEKPDLLMVDGQGIAHPRRLGIAAHLGVVTGLPSIGIAKSRLCGKHPDIDLQKGSVAPVTDKGDDLGFVLRSKDKCNALYISAGHRISHKSALDITLKTLGKYRLPEPTRIADQISKWPLP